MKTHLTRTPVIALTVGLLAGAYLMSTANPAASEDAPQKPAGEVAAATGPSKDKEKLESVTFGSGCFWCTEPLFAELKGVKSAVSGYSGGFIENPTYEQVCTDTTGHAEVVQVTYDPKIISFPELLEVFWKTHDPTTLNQQGADSGTQYRSAVFYHNDEQRKQAEHYMKKLDESGAFGDPIVTEITKLKEFYPAEDYHQDYYATNPRAGYCQMVIRPKVNKFRKVFADKLKDPKDTK